MSNTSMNTAYGLHRTGENKLVNLQEFLNETPDIGGDLSSSTVVATGSNTARSLATRFYESPNIKDYGAQGDGSTDDTAAFNAAVSNIGSEKTMLKIPEGTYVISGTVVIPKNISLSFEGGTLDVSGEFSIFGEIIAGRYQIFQYTGNVLNRLTGEPVIEAVYPEWFGGSMSAVNTPVDVTDEINDALVWSRAVKIWHVKLAGGIGRDTAGGGSRYHVSNLLVPSRTLLEGRDRDDTFIKQISGATGAVISDLPETGAERVKIAKISIDCNNNAGSSGIILGFNPAFVWGVEGYLEDIQVRNFTDYGIRVRASVSQMHRITCITGSGPTNVGLRLEGGSVFCHDYITNGVATPVEFAGSSHKIYGFHTELLVDTVVANWDTGATECMIHGGVFERRSNNPTLAIFRFAASTRRNGFNDFSTLDTQDQAATIYIQDELTNLNSRGQIQNYVQGSERRPTNFVDDNDTNAVGQFRIDNPMRAYCFTGSVANSFFRMPSTSLAREELEIEIVNASDVNIRVEPNERDLGNQIFYGDEENVTIPPRTGYTFKFLENMIIYY